MQSDKVSMRGEGENRQSTWQALVVGVLVAVIGGIIILFLEYGYIKPTLEAEETNTYTTTTNVVKNEVRQMAAKSVQPMQVRVRPIRRWSVQPFLRSVHNAMVFEIHLSGNDEGFPGSTTLQISTRVGGIYSIHAPRGIRPRFGDGESAADWSDQKFSSTTSAVFIDGPGRGVEARILVTIIRKKSLISEDALLILVSPPGLPPVQVVYETQIQWEDEK